MPPTIRDALAATGLDSREAQLLLREALGVEAAYLIAHPEQALTSDQSRVFSEWTSRRAGGEPVAYVTGHREFYGLRLRVTPAVLIPRPETETLVEEALKRLPPGREARALDLGTGSGAVAVAVAKHRPRCQVVASELFVAALGVARENAAIHGLGNIRFVHGDWYESLERQRFDVIVANPPYVAAGDPHLGQGDLRFEPHEALVGGADGLDSIRRIVSGGPQHLVPGGWLLLEHGYDQAPACRELLAQAGFRETFSVRDLAGIERVSGGRAG
ncbi:MAG: peptide chain release factor N(5)-glutamine methyltransferase [Betaproteobacteria bacterium]|nr:peptide chain release factor N(5)-glutamine methyltransferase [Betaproteobacteria bacterium]